MSLITLTQIFIASASAMLLCSCAATHFESPKADHSFVRKVDFTKAPELKELAGHAREFGNEMYPRICALLLDETARPPQRFDITFKPLKSGRWGEAALTFKRIYMNSDFCANNTADLKERFDKAFTHEMTHTAVQSRHWTESLLSSPSPAFVHWGESIADYASYKLIGTNGWWCPECDILYPHYTSGYTCGGAFLLYLDSNYGTNLVRQLVRELRQRSYTDEFFMVATGKSLDALWTEFEETPAFKYGARQSQEFRLALGYTNGQPPKNVFTRFDKYVEKHGDAFTKDAIRSVPRKAKRSLDAEILVTFYSYLTQPGGSYEQFLFDLREDGKLPGIGKDEESWVSMSGDEMKSITFPVSRTIVSGKRGDTSRYHYSVSRASSESSWRLEKAWRTAPDGKVIEEYRVP